MTLDQLDRFVAELTQTKYRNALHARLGRPHISVYTRRAVYARDGYRCQICQSAERISLDHLMPYSLGGSDDESNLRTLCRSCNSSRGARV